MRRFGTQGPVHPQRNYVVGRAAELADFIRRVKEGRYIVIFAPRQTGKTTFFQRALDVFTEESTYFPISLNFEEYEDCTLSVFYSGLHEDICEEIENVFAQRGDIVSEGLAEFLENAEITDHLSMGRFFRRFPRFLGDQLVVLIIDEFDGIPNEAVKGFLHSLRRIYVSNPISRCPHSIGIVGVKSITQLNYDRSISPFNIQDESRYQSGKKQLAAYLKLEGTTEGYYVVFDHRQDPEPCVEVETINDVTIRSYIIPVVQERPSEERFRST